MTENHGRILVVDDDQSLLFTAKMILKNHFEKIETVNNPVLAFEKVSAEAYDVIILDMNYSPTENTGREGIALLKRIIAKRPDAHVIMNTAFADISIAVDAMKEGAVDFLTKPWEKEKLLATVKNVAELSRSRQKLQDLQSGQKVLLEGIDHEFGMLIGSDPAIEEVMTTIEKVATTDASILILGENGTGKELVAREIHRKSLRSGAPFIKVDVGAIPGTLFESEMFGHVKGAFTDAKEERVGRMEVANGGTLFLDEIGNLALPLQAKLLSAIQNRQITRIGSSEPRSIDVRLLTATNTDLYQAVDDNQFRQDLLYRINTVEVYVPALRERLQDIPLLVNHFMEVYRKKYKKPELSVPKTVMSKLTEYPWPGNIRELRHSVERAIIMCDDNTLREEDFILKTHRKIQTETPQLHTVNITEMEKITIEQAVKKNQGNLSKAAQELGMSRSTLYRKMEKYGLGTG